MATSILPIEVIEHVFDFLHDDGQTLYRCVLTHRSWYPRARTLLYSRIEIRSRKSYDAIRTHASRTDPSLGTPCERTLELVVVNGSIRQDYTHEIAFAFAGLFPALRSVTFVHGVYQNTRHLPAFRITPLVLASVQQLTLRCCEFQTFDHLRRTILAFPQLRDLSLHFPLSLGGFKHGHSQSAIFSPQTVNALRLHRLVLSQLKNIKEEVQLLRLLVLEWVDCTPCVTEGTLVEFGVRLALTYPADFLKNERTMNALQKMCRQLASSLVHLDLPGPLFTERQPYSASINRVGRLCFIKFVNLRSLSIRLLAVACRRAHHLRRLAISIEMNVEDVEADLHADFHLREECCLNRLMNSKLICAKKMYLFVTLLWTVPPPATEDTRGRVVAGVDKWLRETPAYKDGTVSFSHIVTKTYPSRRP
ncbi:uncharacterized protein C8Q71DRAFT_863145 [Rhodofomes roseus]|uniref:F-box domain-containing protein n=1 Tax=Rhodofomes roseus TaxID=34475 RepID=A0ABQ8JZ47_9APHY|nr:uncharacterized protein C8Q71DRAFT_863145 [Rhodofomes roseus]KAH9829573.1 hypothetical protein C8Q71DRAFT_863145 [Rhodofomes roseus]